MKVVLLVHEDLVPPKQAKAKEALKAPWRTEYDVHRALESLGHEIEIVGLDQSLAPLQKAISHFRPDIVFNLLEEFAGRSQFEPSVVAYMELIGVRFTGCGSRGLLASQYKDWAKAIVHQAGITTPRHLRLTFPLRKKSPPSATVTYPAIVKYIDEESSMGLSMSNVVRSRRELDSCARKMWRRLEADLLVEDFIAGREFYVSVMGNQRKMVFPPRELCFGGLPNRYPRIASARIKWNSKFRKKHNIYTRTLPAGQKALARRLERAAKECYEALKLSGYARMDFRLDEAGRIYFLEANPNPQICRGEDFADAARAAGFSYGALISRILMIGLRG